MLHNYIPTLALAVLLHTPFVHSVPQQKPLLADPSPHVPLTPPATIHQSQRPLRGRFLHITDFHPDPFYKTHSSTAKDSACHRGSGAAGVFGAETSSCDSPFALINATFDWLDAHVKNEIDFVIWTGDSARHDSDEKIPRTEKQILSLNEMLVTKFYETFGKENQHKHNSARVSRPSDPSTDDYILPIIPTFGNNDIMPHNIMEIGPNRWTTKFSSLWGGFIPEEQRHAFEHGGWFFVEAIPNRLAIFSLNTLYFFDSNGAADGCAKKSEPGYEEMEWLRIQLQFLRERNMKAILMGHVPPARTENKMSWDETCWQKYALWMQQYRDVIVGSVYGHMNLDHFILQDFQDIKEKVRKGRMLHTKSIHAKSSVMEYDFSVMSSAEYLTDLRDDWAHIPDVHPPRMYEDELDDCDGGIWQWAKTLWPTKHKKHKKHRHKGKHLKSIGGKYAERYSVSLVSASVVPNFYPTFRLVEYNITGVDNILDISQAGIPTHGNTHHESRQDLHEYDDTEKVTKKKKHKKKKKKRPTFTVPLPPTPKAPPGPAYSPQTFTWLGMQQWYANLTVINNDFTEQINAAEEVKSEKWKEGKHKHHNHDDDEEDDDKKKHKKGTNDFKFEMEYDTRNDTVFTQLASDLTVRSWVELARGIGSHPGTNDEECDWSSVSKKKKKHKKKKKKDKKRRRKESEKMWYTFLHRAFVGTRTEEELREDF